MNTDRALEGRGDLTEKEYLKKLENLMASETASEEKSLAEFGDMKYEEAKDKYLKNNPGKTEQDFQDAIRRIPMESGGKVIDFAKYAKIKDPEVKEISLSELFSPNKTLASLSKDERAAVNKLLKLTFGRKD
tara:strand:- start:786 stop:1181 length:396 start_codon:yes stop_codon:yes gene_type:complete